MKKSEMVVFFIPILILVLGLFALAYFDVWDWSTKINTGQAFEIIVLAVLVMVTIFYARSASKQANASVKMADGMARPVIDFKRDTAEADIDRRTLEAYAAIHGETCHGLSCILCNIGVGSAIDVRSFIQHPERGRLPFEFGTIESRGKTDRWILSISHESNRIALVASYEDIYGRTLKSSREVSIDKEKGWQLGPLKISPLPQKESNPE